jgi:hypothetical protein
VESSIRARERTSRIRDWDLAEAAIQYVEELRQQGARKHWLRVRTEQEQVLGRAGEGKLGWQPADPPASPDT